MEALVDEARLLGVRSHCSWPPPGGDEALHFVYLWLVLDIGGRWSPDR